MVDKIRWWLAQQINKLAWAITPEPHKSALRGTWRLAARTQWGEQHCGPDGKLTPEHFARLRQAGQSADD
jgi:hypothetical protein